MGYRGNLGCLWTLLLLALIGGSPLLVGLLRVFLAVALVTSIAGLVGSWWIRRRAVEFYTSSQGEAHNRFVELLVVLLVRLAEVDSSLDRREVAAIRRFFERNLGYRDERLVWLRDLIKASRYRTETTEEICAEIAAGYGLQERLIAMRVLAEVARADGAVAAAEMDFVRSVAALLGLGAFAGEFGQAPGQAAGAARVDEALATLGLDRNDSDASAIKEAWRRLSMENHPDRATHLGPEFRRVAEEQMRRINGAYEDLKDAGLVA